MKKSIFTTLLTTLTIIIATLSTSMLTFACTPDHIYEDIYVDSSAITQEKIDYYSWECLLDNVEIVRYIPEYSDEDRILAKIINSLENHTEVDKELQISFDSMDFDIFSINFPRLMTKIQSVVLKYQNSHLDIFPVSITYDFNSTYTLEIL